jgi:hypothetical protein
MSKRHHFFLLDHMVLGLKPEFREGITETILDGGLKPDADDMEVIDLALIRHAILVTADVGILPKCKVYQDRSRDCLYGLLLLPDGIETQRRLLSDLREGTKQMRHARYDRPLTWADVHHDNLVVKVYKSGDPNVEELCNCPWDED